MAKQNADNPHVTCPRCRAELTFDPNFGTVLAAEAQVNRDPNGHDALQESNSAPSRRHAEMEWLRRNTSRPGPYNGKWVVVEKDELIASDKEYSKARAEAVQRGIERPFIVFVPEVEEAEFMGI
jgi:hypothetical protein